MTFILAALYLAFGAAALVYTGPLFVSLQVPVIGPDAEFELATSYGGINLLIGVMLLLSLFKPVELRLPALGILCLINLSLVLARGFLYLTRLSPSPAYFNYWIFECGVLAFGAGLYFYERYQRHNKRYFY